MTQSSYQRTATGSTASVITTSSGSTKYAGCSPRRARNWAAPGLTTWKERSGSCGSGCVMLRRGSRTGVLLLAGSCCLTVFRKARQHDQRQIDRAVRANVLCKREHHGPAAGTYGWQV